jgi:transcriptional regulator with XRE-family HTH domain
MGTTSKPKPKFNTERIASDMAIRGWNHSDLARATGKSVQTITRFLSSEVQTAKVAAAIAQALGHTVRRYFSHVEAA